MRRALYLTLLFYPLIVVAAVASLAGETSPEGYGPPAFQGLFVAWLVDGSVLLVAAVGVLVRALRGGFTRKTALRASPPAALGLVLGLPPAYVLLDLANKLFRLVLTAG